MKVRIEYDYDVSDFKLLDVKTRKEYYEKYFNKDGVLFDDEMESIYYDLELPYLPIKGQLLTTRWGDCEVLYSCWNLEPNDNGGYYDISLIMVHEP